MPIAAFVEASKARMARGEAISSYALVLPKTSAFRVGARPVVYGLSSPAQALIDPDTDERCFPETALPMSEQFRYVAYDPTSGRQDWTHEREWRWSLGYTPQEDPDGCPPADSDDIPGLDIDHRSLRGIGVIVRTGQEAQYLVNDILTKVDRGDLSEGHYQFVLAHEQIPDWSLLRDTTEIERAIHRNMIDLEPYFALTIAEADELVAEVDRLAAEIEAQTEKCRDGFHEHGGCWLWVRNNRHPIVRALMKKGRCEVTKDGHYLVELPDISSERPLHQRQAMIDTIAATLASEYDLPGTYYAVGNSGDLNAIPSYHNDDQSDPFFYNLNWQA